MKATKTLMVAALAAAGMGMATLAEAQKHGGNGYRGGGQYQGGHGGYRHGGHRYYGGSYWGPYWGWGIGLPLAIGSAWAWGHPYYYDAPRVVYAEPGYIGRVRPLPGDQGIRIEGEARPVEPAPAPQPQPQPLQPQGTAPSTGPLYMNYCESARAYYPKVTSCPEGWRFQAPAQ